MASRGQKKFNRRHRQLMEAGPVLEEDLLERHPVIALKHFNREEWKIHKELEAAKVRYSPMRIKTMKARTKPNAD